MNENEEMIDSALLCLDILTVLLVDDNPVLGVSFVVLVKMATEDRTQRLLFIVLIIVLSLLPHE